MPGLCNMFYKSLLPPIWQLPEFNKAQRTGSVPQLIFANTLYLGLIPGNLVIWIAIIQDLAANSQ